MTKQEIQQVFNAEKILNTNLYHNGVCPSDLTADEYLEDIYLIINDTNYRNELIEENKEGEE
jgi:hypothetical protein